MVVGGLELLDADALLLLTDQQITAAFAFLLGTVSLVKLHYHKIRNRADDRGFSWVVFFGLALLFPLQAWGIGFDILKTLAFDLGPEIRGRLDLAPWALEATALGYQFGTLVLPAVAPVALWLGQHRIFVASLAPGMAERFATPRRRD